MKPLSALPGVRVDHCAVHRVVHVTIGGTTIELDEDDFLRVAYVLHHAVHALSPIEAAPDERKRRFDA
jgi:hypothetical protein